MAASEAQKRAMKRHYEKNREHIRAQQAAYRAEHLVEEAERAATYYAEHQAALRARAKENGKVYREGIRKAVIEAYGGTCACCANTFMAHLTLDHIDGSGAEERRQLGSGQAVYRRLVRECFPEGYQVLCFNCNSAKHYLGRCPCSDGDR